MKNLSRSEFLILIEGLGLPVPVDLDDVGGLLEQSGRDSAIAYMEPLPTPLESGWLDMSIVAVLPFPWGLEYLRKNNESAMFLDHPFEAAFVGVWWQGTTPPVAVYDRLTVIKLIAEMQNPECPDYGLAVCQFEAEIGSVYHGEGTPAFLTRYTD